MWLKKNSRVCGVIAFAAASTISLGSDVIVGRGNVRTLRPSRSAARSQHHCIVWYSWSVSRISPGGARGREDATRLTAAVTLVVKTSRRGSPPRKLAKRSRASHKSEGTQRSWKSIGSSAR
jgi:hypothetical protein